MDIALNKLPGIGPARLKALENAGIFSVRQLVEYLPRAYRNLSDRRSLASLRAGEEAAVSVRVSGGVSEHRSGRLLITRTYVEDDTDRMAVVWYNQPWLKRQLTPGKPLLLYGRVEAKYGTLVLSCPVFEQGDGLVPVYKPISGLSNKLLRQCILDALSVCEGQWPDELPESVRLKYRLCERNYAMLNAHNPISIEALEAARRRLSFEELLLYQVSLGLLRGNHEAGVVIPASQAEAQAYWAHLGFEPTGAQRRVLEEIRKDMVESAPMARLVQGDVGCGKTAIAFGALYLAAQHGWQGALMAPTEILAGQHLETAQKVLEPLGVRCGLLTGSLTVKQRREAREKIASGAWQVVIGTHALISEGVEYKNLGLVITDEQHRFGVKQRTQLSAKGQGPNVLVMSATPIPRTLSLILYGDLDISIVDELPPGRTPVKTSIVPERKRADMYGFLRKEVAEGRQVYIVCPLVEESEALEAQSAQQLYERLRTHELKGIEVALVHGKMRPQDKDEVLERFHAGEIKVLVSTTVIEVGINVPNASVMVIENAERFGLAQLHQLRGRVGRGSQVSWCFLMAEPNERLKLMTQTNDGFLVAQKDLELRGPGEIFGERQSGLAAPMAGAMLADAAMLKETHDAAREIMKDAERADHQAVIRLARQVFERRFREVALN
jgi:ATP-dependent DNA helicase RecG